jgi:hypothetical protein
VTDRPPSPGEGQKVEIDTTVPAQARIWNYWLGGKDNYAVDREVGDKVLAAFPEMVETARESRVFLISAVEYLAGQAGIRQFLDIGTGLPTANNTHGVAQRVAPDSRIVYVDFDPIVLAHARALLTSDPMGATDYIDADLRDTDTILREAARTLDFAKPTALMLCGILGAIDTYDEARSIVRRLMDVLPSGSYLVIGDGANTSEKMVEGARIRNQTAKPAYHVRSPEEIAGYFEGLELVEPGVVSISRWRPEPSPSGPPAEAPAYGGIGRKR